MGDLDEETMDLNIDNYTTDELLLIYNLDSNSSKNEIYAQSSRFLERFKGDDKKEFYDFFEKARSKLITSLDFEYNFDEEYSLLITQEDETKVDPAHINSNKKILEDRYVYDDRDSNIVVNKVMKTLVINSEYLTNENSISDFTFNFSDTLYQVLSLSLYSYSIPYSYYVIDESYNNDRFIIEHNSNSSLHKTIIIPSGNYDANSLIPEIQRVVNSTKDGIGVREDGDSYITFSYNSINGKISIFFNYATYDNIIFYNQTFGSPNNNLGYMMGFRKKNYQKTSDVNQITSESLCNLGGTKYLQIYIDDFQKNRLPSNLLNAYDEENKKIDNNNKFQYVERDADENNNTFGYVIPSEPRFLTQNQIYAINASERANSGSGPCGITPFVPPSENINPPNDTDLFAIIYPSSSFNSSSKPSLGDILSSSDISLPYNKRIYFGPTNLEKLHIKILDDKGNLVNFNGNHYNICLLCECLYKKPK